MPGWTLITNHGAVLSYIAHHPQITARELAAQAGITERAVLRIIRDLEAEGYLTRRRVGRRNVYQVNHEMPFRRRDLHDREVKELLEVLAPRPASNAPEQERATAAD
ncbi:MAG: winged helix-turn-helix transcriptional regulator [Chloroflexi bacterium]|nr:winged helix-turn-helix transcriptional regulator [Chloroflexota bacterium]